MNKFEYQIFLWTLVKGDDSSYLRLANTVGSAGWEIYKVDTKNKGNLSYLKIYAKREVYE